MSIFATMTLDLRGGEGFITMSGPKAKMSNVLDNYGPLLFVIVIVQGNVVRSRNCDRDCGLSMALIMKGIGPGEVARVMRSLQWEGAMGRGIGEWKDCRISFLYVR